MTENIIDSTEKQAASAAVRRKREEEARQRERYVPDLLSTTAPHIPACICTVPEMRTWLSSDQRCLIRHVMRSNWWRYAADALDGLLQTPAHICKRAIMATSIVKCQHAGQAHADFLSIGTANT